MANIPEEREGFLTTRATAIALNCTMGNVYALRRTGVLQGEKRGGAWYYSQEEVAQARRYQDRSKKPSAGRLQRRVYEHFKRGSTDAEIIIDLELTTQKLAQYKAAYSPDWWELTPERTRRLRRLLRAHGLPLDSPAALERALEHLCKRERQLCALELAGLQTSAE